MALQQTDLISSCKSMARLTNNRYEIIPTKSEYWYWKLEIKETETWRTERLVWWLTTREAYETLRGVYATYRFLNSNN